MKGNLTRVWVATIRVRDLEKSIQFYHDVLGMKVRLDARKYKWVELGPDEPQAKVGLREISNSEKDKVVGVKTGIVFDTDDILELHKRLLAEGVIFTRDPSKTPWGGMIADFLDPEGNEVEVVQDAKHYDQDFPPEGKATIR